MDWKVAEQLLIKARAVNLMSENHMVRNNLCDLIDMILDELHTLGNSSHVYKRLPEDLWIDRLPDDDQGYQPRRLPRKPDERGYRPIRRKLPPTSDFPMPPSS